MIMLSTLVAGALGLERPVGSPAARAETGPSHNRASTARPVTRKHERVNHKPDFRIASSRQEWEAALGLVYRAYVRSGLIQINRYRMRVTPYHAQPTTEVLIGGHGDEVLCTLSIIGDGHLGLPMEAIYGEEVERRRLEGLRLAEVSCLADERDGSDQSFSMVARLMALTAQSAAYRGIDQLLIAVHPRHAKFYERFIAFQLIGEKRTYASVRDHPAVAMALDLNSLSFDHPRAYKRLFGVSFDADDLEYRPASHELKSDLRRMAAETYVDQSAVLACA
jgi:N-acyl amino acid synthase FeeM